MSTTSPVYLRLRKDCGSAANRRCGPKAEGGASIVHLDAKLVAHEPVNGPSGVSNGDFLDPCRIARALCLPAAAAQVPAPDTVYIGLWNETCLKRGGATVSPDKWRQRIANRCCYRIGTR
jgi:hypothetical protein